MTRFPVTVPVLKKYKFSENIPNLQSVIYSGSSLLNFMNIANVAFQIPARSCSILAQLTFVRLLARVRAHMIFEITRLIESSVTMRTFERSLIRVNSQMRFECATLCGRIVAFGAFERSLARMRPHVRFET